jgi:hypothetical protein
LELGASGDLVIGEALLIDGTALVLGADVIVGAMAVRFTTTG